MTDTIFNLYGGSLDGSVPAQRTAAYCIAEVAAEMDLGTFLLPTVYTGTYMWSSEINLDHSYVTKLYQTQFADFEEDVYFTVTGTANIYQAMRDWEYGILNLSLLYASSCSGCKSPWQVKIVYQAGLSSGTSYTPNVLMSLTTYSQIVLNEMIGYGNEAPGDVGVKEYSNMDYTEKRVAMLQTSFGTSAKSNFAHKLLSGLRKYKIAGMSVPYRLQSLE
jgi:hypothetical protein